MKFKEFLKNLIVNIKDGVSRFLVAFICSISGFLTVSYTIIFEVDSDDIIVPLCMTYAIVAILSVLLKTAEEYLTAKISRIIQYPLCAIVGIAAFVLIKTNYESIYTIMIYSGIVIALLCFIFFIIMRGDSRDTAFPKIVSSLVFSTAICGVLSAGLSTCIAAFQNLLFSWDNFYKVYLIVNIFIWAIGFINLFLALMPKKDIAVAQSKIFRTIVLFTALPLYILLIAILLVYLAKIVVTQNMPVGEINWFASFASLFFIFLLMSVIQYTDKLAKLFVKFGGYFLIPVLIMQSIAVFERINAYGLTTPRTVSLVLIIISVLFIIGALIIPKHLNKIALVSGIIVLIVTVTPFNVINMPISSQTKILKTTLLANDMLQNGVVVANKNISKTDAEKIISAYNYLIYNAEKTPDFIEDENKSFEEIFGFAETYTDENSYIYCSYNTKDTVDISGYNKMIEIFNSEYSYKTSEPDGKNIDIDLKQIAKDLYEQYDNHKDDIDIYVVDENTALYFRDFSFEFTNNEVNEIYFDGYVLVKN